MKDTELNKSATFLDNVLTIKHFFERNEGPAFLFAVSDSFHVRKQVNEAVIAYCKERNKTIGIAELVANAPTGFLTQLNHAKEEFADGLIINNLDSLISATQGAFASDFNQMREGLIALGIPLLIWLGKQSHDIFTHSAIDLYLRRDLSTLFFEDNILTDYSGSMTRFTESARESPDFEETRMRVALLEQQLKEARDDDFPRSRLANEIVLPLIQAYVDNSMLQEAKKLLNEFEQEFDYNKTDADAIIAHLFQNAGNLDQAIAHFEKALNSHLILLDHTGPVIARDYNDLGFALRRRGNLDTAIVCFEKALQTELEFSGKENANIGFYYNNLGKTWQDKGDWNKALEYSEKALKIAFELFGEYNLNTTTCYNNIGTICYRQENIDKAIEYFEKALNIDLELLGEGSSMISIRYNNLGLAWQDKGNLDKAIVYFENALKISLKLFGEENENVAINYNNLGGAWQVKGDLNKTIIYVEKAVEIYLKNFGEDNPRTALCYNNIGMVWQSKGDFMKAITFLEKAFSIFLKLYGADNPSTKTAKQNYQDCLQEMASS